MAFLDSIKDRLGFGEGEEEEFDEELYGDEYDSHADRTEDYSSYDDDEYVDNGEEYSSFKPATTRSSRSGRRERGERGASGRRSTPPNLVSIDDVRNSTRVPDSLGRDPLPPRRQSNFGRNVVGHASDYALSGSEAAQGARDGAAQERPSFETGSGAPAGGYDPYRVYEAGSASSHRPSRSVSVISPVAYSEVENVARMLRAGDAVVLSLRNTPNQLSKRILDFSFGVASALDATVDCIADKVFAITRVSGLDDDELSRLRSQGVI